MKLKLLAIILATLILNGCAPTLYVKPGASEQDWSRDYNDCLVKANQAGYTGGDLAANLNRSNFLDMCVQGQGWTVQTKESAQAQSQQQSDLNRKKADYNSTMNALDNQMVQVCAKPEYDLLIKKSPCDSTNISMDQMADDSKIATKLKKKFLAFRKEIQNLSKQKREFLRLNALVDNDRRLADQMESTELDSIGNSLDLHNGKITWGEYNKIRKDIAAKAQAEWRRIFRPEAKK